MSRATTAAMKAGQAMPNYPGRDLLQSVLAPVVEPVAARVAGNKVQRLLGFWVLWHAYGGLKGLEERAPISRSGIYHQRAEFAEVFGTPVEDFLPQVAAAFALREQVAALVVAS